MLQVVEVSQATGDEGRLQRFRLEETMLQALDNFEGLALEALDGDIGRVDDFRFDDEHWAIRYLVVRTEPWLGRHVLISPISVRQPDWVAGKLEVRLTRDQIRNSPEVPVSGTLSREEEEQYASHYGYSVYWGGPHPWGWAGFPGALAGSPPPEYTPPKPGDIARAAIRSVHALRGAHVHARDGEIGHVDDCVVDDESWRIRYLLIDTSNWIGGTHVLVPTESIRAFDWADGRLNVNLTTNRIRSAPRYDAARPIDGSVEEAIDNYYGLRTQQRSARARGASALRGADDADLL
jgi:hypothetical protein